MHPDLYESYEGEPYSHACTVKRIVDDNLVNPRHILQVGIRAATAEQRDYASSRDMSIFSTACMHGIDRDASLRSNSK